MSIHFFAVWKVKKKKIWQKTAHHNVRFKKSKNVIELRERILQLSVDWMRFKKVYIYTGKYAKSLYNFQLFPKQIVESFRSFANLCSQQRWIVNWILSTFNDIDETKNTVRATNTRSQTHTHTHKQTGTQWRHVHVDDG